MSMQVVFEGAGSKKRHYLLAWICVSLARPLAKMQPNSLCRVLNLLSRGARPSLFAEAARARKEVCVASSKAAGMECLLRSVSVFLLCRMRGHVPTWCTGFRVDPFAAHAWVEVDGVPVNELPEIAEYKRVTVVPMKGSLG